MSTGNEEVRDSGGRSDPYVRIAKLARALERYKTMAGNAIEERDALIEKLEGMQAAQTEWENERKEWEVKADANVERKRADGFAQQLRELKHRDHFTKVASAAGAAPDVIEDLWKLSGYKPEKDEVDVKAIEGLVDGLRSDKPRWFEPISKPAPTQNENGDRPAPSPGRGQGVPGPRGKTYTTADLHDPKNVMDPEFMREYNIAYKEGRVQRVGVDAGL